MCVRHIQEYYCTPFSIYRSSNSAIIKSVQRVFNGYLLVHSPHTPHRDHSLQLRIEPVTKTPETKPPFRIQETQ